MEAPYHSSGAISRAHYTIVRKVETASSTFEADQHIFLEIKSVKEQLMDPNLAVVCQALLIIS